MRELIKAFIQKLKNKIKQYPRLKNKIIYVLNYFPNLKKLLIGIQSPYSIYENWKPSSINSELLIDVSHLYREDLKTGIQRVVRSILNYFESKSMMNLDVQPIFLTDVDGYWCYKYVKSFETTVVPKKGDIFLGLDLNTAIYVLDETGLFKDWNKRGLEINFVVYDILPIQFPQFWTQDVSITHKLWLNSIIKYSSKLICISKAVSEDLNIYINIHKNEFLEIPKIEWFHLGADIENSQPTKGMPSNANEILQKLNDTKSFLMVSTLEPRKGYLQTLKAFEQLWNDGVDVLLVIVGKLGWMMDDLKNKLDTHPERDKRLLWLTGISDEYLNKIYKSSTCLLVSSEAEGFGLPLIEAAQHKKPIIARDIPVFQEVAGKCAYYFENSNDIQVIEKTIKEWLNLFEKNSHPKSDEMIYLTWEDSGNQLLEKIIE